MRRTLAIGYDTFSFRRLTCDSVFRPCCFLGHGQLRSLIIQVGLTKPFSRACLSSSDPNKPHEDATCAAKRFLVKEYIWYRAERHSFGNTHSFSLNRIAWFTSYYSDFQRIRRQNNLLNTLISMSVSFLQCLWLNLQNLGQVIQIRCHK